MGMANDTTPRSTWFDAVITNLPSFPHLTFSRKALVVACLFLVGIIGYIDYLTGYERSLLLFYLLPISLAARFGSWTFGLAIVGISVAVWKQSDIAAGTPLLGWLFSPMRFLRACYRSYERLFLNWIDACVNGRRLCSGRSLSGSGLTRRLREWPIANDAVWARTCMTALGSI